MIQNIQNLVSTVQNTGKVTNADMDDLVAASIALGDAVTDQLTVTQELMDTFQVFNSTLQEISEKMDASIRKDKAALNN